MPAPKLPDLPTRFTWTEPSPLQRRVSTALQFQGPGIYLVVENPCRGDDSDDNADEGLTVAADIVLTKGQAVSIAHKLLELAGEVPSPTI